MQLITNVPANLLAILGALDALGVGMFVGLIREDIPLDATTTLAECVAAIATYSGYAPKAVTWQPAASISDSGQAEVIGLVPEFRPTGAAITNSIYALFVYQDLADEMPIFVARFDDGPLPMIAATSMIIVTLRYRMTQGGIVNVVS